MDTTPNGSRANKTLLVDDDELVRKAFARAVSSAGFEVDTAKDAWAAMKMVRRTHYAVVVLDYRMPGLDGLELKEELSATLPDASYVLLTGNLDLDLAMRAVNDHAVHYVVAKPWNLDDLASTLNRAMEDAWERSLAHQLAARTVGNALTAAGANASTDQLLSSEARALSAALRARSPDLADAADRIAAIARAIGRELGLTGRELLEVEAGGQLADIGYLGIPDAIFSKEGPLSEEERAVMMRHPQLGEELLAALPNLTMVRRIVREHQERWDGAGYPNHLAGPKICVGARVVAVAQALDAMMSPRAYRPAATFDLARDEIVKMCGSQFDPEAVQAFLRVPASLFAELRGAAPDAVPAPTRVA